MICTKIDKIFLSEHIINIKALQNYTLRKINYSSLKHISHIYLKNMFHVLISVCNTRKVPLMAFNSQEKYFTCLLTYQIIFFPCQNFG